MQAMPVGYILENVPPLGIVDLQVQADAQLVCLTWKYQWQWMQQPWDLMPIGFDGSGRI